MTHVFPTLNASLNALASIFLVTGFIFIRKRMIPQHRAMMIAAFSTSVLFLVSYLAYHLTTHIITPFQGQGAVRHAYFALLISHSALAPVVPVLAVLTLRRGLKGVVPQHRRIAHWTLPMWLYVSVTGVLVYLMLYHLPV